MKQHIKNLTAITILSLALANNVHAEFKPTLAGRLVRSFNQSSFIQWLEKKSSPMYTGMIAAYGNQPASEEFQKLGKEAQTLVGIPEEKHVPIKKLDPNSPLGKLAGAYAIPGAIFVNEEKLGTRSLGCQRIALIHEAIHIKYHDMTNILILELILLSTYGVSLHKLLNLVESPGGWMLHYPLVIVATFIAAAKTGSFYEHYREQRADLEAIYTVNCSECAHEFAQDRHKLFDIENHSLKHSGYLSPQEIEKIAEELKDQQKLCEYHTEQLK